MATFSERLKSLREEKGLLQRELAHQVNLSRVAITYYEQGKRFPDRDTLIKLAKFFNVSLDYLLGASDIKRQPDGILDTRDEILDTREASSDLGTRLRELRMARGLRQEDVAAVIGVTPEAIGMYENGKREPKGEILVALADFFSVPVDYLLGREKKTLPPIDLKEALTKNDYVLVDGKPLSPGDKKRLATLIDTAMSFKKLEDKAEVKEADKEPEEPILNPDTFQEDFDIERLAAHLEGEYGRKPSQEFLKWLAGQIKSIRCERGIEE
ncbi:MAG: helix-turn-helix domain-containing protein [Firmicutes bacterium]|nr:helix-turn-helix domain-containing protein [Bacillota bacterium]